MSGAGVDNNTWRYLFRPERHDSGTKEFLGVTSAITPDDVIDIILRQPRAAEHLIERLWIEFVSPNVDRSAVQELAVVFKENDFEMLPLLQALLEHPSFWERKNRMTLVKSPVELLLSAHRKADVPVKDFDAAVSSLQEMGQDLFNPPDVGGWSVGNDWIDSDRLAKRHKYLLGLKGAADSKQNLDIQLK